MPFFLFFSVSVAGTAELCSSLYFCVVFHFWLVTASAAAADPKLGHLFFYFTSLLLTAAISFHHQQQLLLFFLLSVVVLLLLLNDNKWFVVIAAHVPKLKDQFCSFTKDRFHLFFRCTFWGGKPFPLFVYDISVPKECLDFVEGWQKQFLWIEKWRKVDFQFWFTFFFLWIVTLIVTASDTN